MREQLAGAQEWVQRHVPGYRFRTLALPLGSYPKELGWAVSGEAKGMTYKHDAILMVAGGAAPSPHARNFDPNRLPRIQAVERGPRLLDHLLRQEPRRALRERRGRRDRHGGERQRRQAGDDPRRARDRAAVAARRYL